ncbi:MAG: hypothetical protein ACJAVW_002332, partial [Spirosomataceae bacterium]
VSRVKMILFRRKGVGRLKAGVFLAWEQFFNHEF